MEEYICYPAQKGFYAGPVLVLTAPADVTGTKADPTEEAARLDNAISSLRQSVKSSSVSKENADIMETVSLMLEDETFIGEIYKYIADQRCNAEYAVKIKSAEYAKRMEDADSDYLRARASDIAGVGQQLICLMDKKENPSLNGLSALVGTDISPARLAGLESEFIGGIITEKGSPNSHLSILAGDLDIPYIYGNAKAVEAASKSGYIIIDGDKLITDPDDSMKTKAKVKMADTKQKKANPKGSDSTVRCKTKIYANISGPEDIPALIQSGADGVGLFRSEFLFLGKDLAPDEEEQYRAYKSVLEAMGDKEVIIRTMDLGSDKSVHWLKMPDEPNPALGLRGVRVSLEKKEIFRTQLRALLRAAKYGNLKIMFPMITSEWEIDEIKECVKSAAAELEAEKTEYALPPLGIMAETPAAALTADILSKKVDFISIGTNDLTQYTLALDREESGLDRYFDPHHESVLRLIESVIRESHKNGTRVGICGALAADPAVIARLIASGVDELSVPISKVNQTRISAANAEKTTGAPQPLLAPCDGEQVPMADIPDPVFASGKLGKCIGIIPDNGSIYAPCDGSVISIAKTLHALTIRSDDGNEYLLHIGINTVNLSGRGFTVLVSEGDRIQKSQKIIDADLELIRESGCSTMVILVKL